MISIQVTGAIAILLILICQLPAGDCRYRGRAGSGPPLKKVYNVADVNGRTVSLLKLLNNKIMTDDSPMHKSVSVSHVYDSIKIMLQNIRAITMSTSCHFHCKSKKQQRIIFNFLLQKCSDSDKLFLCVF